VPKNKRDAANDSGFVAPQNPTKKPQGDANFFRVALSFVVMYCPKAKRSKNAQISANLRKFFLYIANFHLRSAQLLSN
jgi:hypothetical protein